MKNFLVIFWYVLAAISGVGQNSLLWKVEHPQNPGLTSYVFGTMHLQDSAINCFGNEVWDAIASCELVACELDLKDPNLMLSMMSKVNMKDSTLSDLLTSDQMKSVTRVMSELIDPFLWTMSQKMKPFFLVAPIYVAIDRAPKYDLPMDLRIMNAGKSTFGLETLDEQMSAVESISLKEQAKMLYDITQNLDSLRDGFAEMKRLYMSQDIDAMLAYTATMEKSDPTFSSNFITTRNQRMAERLIPLLNKQTVFCAVGAAHLAGEQGVLNYIRKKGFILSPIKFSFMSEGCR